MKVKPNILLIIAAFVWMIAGFNVLKIGVIAYEGNLSILNVLLSLSVFLIFWFKVFKNLVEKHTKRILTYDKKVFFMNFFDLKSFMIMSFMITFGVLLRVFNVIPEVWIARFYVGLGFSLFSAGVLFFYYFFTNRNLKTIA